MISDKDRLALDRASKWPELGWLSLKHGIYIAAAEINVDEM